MDETDELFSAGVTAFNECRFYEAHEFWESLWSDYKLPDAKLVQGLIQLSVAYFHITNHNLKGARSLMKKCLPKLEVAMDTERIVNMEDAFYIALSAATQLDKIESTTEFNWNDLMKLEQHDH